MKAFYPTMDKAVYLNFVDVIETNDPKAEDYDKVYSLLVDVYNTKKSRVHEKSIKTLITCILRDLPSSDEKLKASIIKVLLICSQNNGLVYTLLRLNFVEALLNIVLSDSNNSSRSTWLNTVKTLAYVPATIIFNSVKETNLDIHGAYKKMFLAEDVPEQIRKMIMDNALELLKLFENNEGLKLFYNTFFSILFAHNNSYQDVRLQAAEMISFREKFPLKLLPTEEKLAFISELKTNYVPYIKTLLDAGDMLWKRLWIFVVDVLGTELHGNFEIINLILNVTENAFRKDYIEYKIAGYDCWMALINNYSLNLKYMCSTKHMKLIMKPLIANLSKNNEVTSKRLQVWYHLICTLKASALEYYLEPFLCFCFGPLGEVPLLSLTQGAVSSVGKKTPTVWKPATQIFIQILGHNGPECCQTSGKFARNACLRDETWLFTMDCQENEVFFKTNIVHIVNAVGECSLLALQWANLKIGANVISCLWKSLLLLGRKLKENEDERKFEDAVVALVDAMFDVQEKNTQIFFQCIVPILLILELPDLFEPTTFDSLLLRNLDKMRKIELKNISKQIPPRKKEEKSLPECSIELKSPIFQIFLNVTKKITDVNRLKIYYLFWEQLCGLILKKNESQEIAINFMMWPLRNYIEDITFQFFDRLAKLFQHLCASQVSLADVLVFIKPLIREKQNLNKLVLQVLEKLVDSTILKTAGDRRKLLDFGTHVMDQDISSNNYIVFKQFASTLIQYLTNMNKEPIEPEMSTFVMNYHLKLCDNELLDKVLKFYEKFSFANPGKNIPQATITKLTNFYESLRPDDGTGHRSKLKKLVSLLKPAAKPKSDNSKLESTSRGAKIVGLLINSKEKIDDAKPTILLGHNLATMTPVQLKGSILNNPSPTAKPVVPANKSPSVKPNPPLKQECSSDYVVIDTEYKFSKKNLNEHQKEVLRKRRDDIPALYCDLTQSVSQDMFSPLGSSEDCHSATIDKPVPVLPLPAVDINSAKDSNKLKRVPTQFNFDNVSSKTPKLEEQGKNASVDLTSGEVGLLDSKSKISNEKVVETQPIQDRNKITVEDEFITLNNEAIIDPLSLLVRSSKKARIIKEIPQNGGKRRPGRPKGTTKAKLMKTIPTKMEIPIKASSIRSNCRRASLGKESPTVTPTKSSLIEIVLNSDKPTQLSKEVVRKESPVGSKDSCGEGDEEKPKLIENDNSKEDEKKRKFVENISEQEEKKQKLIEKDNSKEAEKKQELIEMDISEEEEKKRKLVEKNINEQEERQWKLTEKDTSKGEEKKQELIEMDISEEEEKKRKLVEKNINEQEEKQWKLIEKDNSKEEEKKQELIEKDIGEEEEKKRKLIEKNISQQEEKKRKLIEKEMKKIRIDAVIADEIFKTLSPGEIEGRSLRRTRKSIGLNQKNSSSDEILNLTPPKSKKPRKPNKVPEPKTVESLQEDSEDLVESSQESFVAIKPSSPAKGVSSAQKVAHENLISISSADVKLKSSCVVLNKLASPIRKCLTYDSQESAEAAVDASNLLSQDIISDPQVMPDAVEEKVEPEPPKKPEVFIPEFSLQTISQMKEDTYIEQDSRRETELTEEEKVFCALDTETVQMDDDVKQLPLQEEPLQPEEMQKEDDTVDVKTPEEDAEESINVSPPLMNFGINESIRSSPITAETPERKQQLLDSTLDMSPIQLEESTFLAGGDCIDDESSSSCSLDEAKETLINAELLQIAPPKDIDIETLIPKDDGEELKDENRGIKGFTNRTNKLLHLVLEKNSVTPPRRIALLKSESLPTKSNSSNSPTTSSKSRSRFWKILESYEDGAKDKKERSGTPVQDTENVEVLCFSKEVPSPLATPEASILKRKHPDNPESGGSPAAKRKRVNFSDPLTTSTKIFFTEKRLSATKLAKKMKLDKSSITPIKLFEKTRSLAIETSNEENDQNGQNFIKSVEEAEDEQLASNLDAPIETHEVLNVEPEVEDDEEDTHIITVNENLLRPVKIPETNSEDELVETSKSNCQDTLSPNLIDTKNQKLSSDICDTSSKETLTIKIPDAPSEGILSPPKVDNITIKIVKVISPVSSSSSSNRNHKTDCETKQEYVIVQNSVVDELKNSSQKDMQKSPSKQIGAEKVFNCDQEIEHFKEAIAQVTEKAAAQNLDLQFLDSMATLIEAKRKEYCRNVESPENPLEGDEGKLVSRFFSYLAKLKLSDKEKCKKICLHIINDLFDL